MIVAASVALGRLKRSGVRNIAATAMPKCSSTDCGTSGAFIERLRQGKLEFGELAGGRAREGFAGLREAFDESAVTEEEPTVFHAAKAIKVDAERGTIAPGKLADLVLIAGEPHKTIGDIEKINRIFLGGRELDRERLAREIASPTLSAIPAIKAQELVDDFERTNGRSQLDTLWVNSSDAGVDPSKIVFGRVARGDNNHALSISARMSEKERPFARVNVPLSRGAIEPVDARGFRGVQFDARGEGEYRMIVPIYNTRSASSYFSVPFNASPQWQTLKLDFASFKQAGARSPVQWTGADLLMLSFEVARPAGSFGWLELDNIKFYR